MINVLGTHISGQTANQYDYIDLLKRLREKIVKTRPELWSDRWLLHQDSVSGPICQAVSDEQKHYCDGAYSLFT
ncbi:hypothetical protein TNCV_2629181 [Trichonephila clavipes]|uniref:Uncharacterized protein n=1 Tax=Trichonephila clavipes TaxID=2585209 RepID=A0A8X6VK59_TRICX|nr:hypothetical protein TNCV_2629181 [Trichonephila clavipes]